MCGHQKCRYRNNEVGCCQFILIEGHSRGCKPEECQKWRTRNAGVSSDAEVAEEKKGKRHDEAEVLRLYINGATDREIADKLGVSRETITGWRKRRGLVCHKKARSL